jgi:hypothetical protein
MSAKQRIKQLEKARANTNGGAARIVVMYDADGDGLAEFDGVQMTQAEAERKAAACPDNVTIIHVVYESEDTGGEHGNE